MKCYHHDTRDAVGICKSCGKGLCTECAVDMHYGLACKGRCERAAEELISLIQQNVTLRQTAATATRNIRPNTYIQAALLTVFGVAFGGMGLQVPGLMPYMCGLAVVCFAYAAYAVWRALQLPKQ